MKKNLDSRYGISISDERVLIVIPITIASGTVFQVTANFQEYYYWLLQTKNPFSLFFAKIFWVLNNNDTRREISKILFLMDYF